MREYFSSSTALYNKLFIEQLYNKYLKDPSSIDQSWQDYFRSLKEENENLIASSLVPSWVKKSNNATVNNKDTNTGAQDNELRHKNTADSTLLLKVNQLINAFREYGHIIAKLDPLGINNNSLIKELQYHNYGISDEELEQRIHINGKSEETPLSVREIYQTLLKTYSGTFSIEVNHLDNIEEKEWLRNKIENSKDKINLRNSEKVRILNSLIEVEMFESYLHTKFPGAKRFSIEGAEGVITAIEEIIQIYAQDNIEEIVLGMAHRGRLSILTKVMQKPHHIVFSEFSGGTFIPESLNLPSDVKYHVGFSFDAKINTKNIHLTLTPNPSHLELVNSVVLGRVRAKQDLIHDKKRSKVTSILIHGDAALSGQGSVMESLALTGTDAHKTGGTVHIVINNQIGFTTSPIHSRSSRYCTDVAKVINAPILHVNGDDPESIAHVSKIAACYRNKFKKDIFIDIVCYRRYGHNEGDEPMFTQPKMYKIIQNHDTPSKIYSTKLLDKGCVSEEFLQTKKKEFKELLDKEFKISRSYKSIKASWLEGHWKEFDASLAENRTKIKTGLKDNDIQSLISPLTDLPYNISVNNKVKTLLKNRKKMLDSEQGIDWGMGETLAYASLLKSGCDIRFIGEDVERGTFSHRHAVIVDQKTEEKYIPLNNLGKDCKGRIEIKNSILSELAVMGFEYGYSYSRPDSLVIWEAQFGDFANGAQMIIDQYLVSSRAKWLRMSGLVLLLPHGYEGQGPEHSSARPERFLQLGAQNNITVANCTTPASIFHLLRRQSLRSYKNPLIIMTPKSLLRHRLAVSGLVDFTGDTYFKPLIEDDLHNVSNITKVILCSGKVYYDLYEERKKRQDQKVALIRLEELYPYPKNEIIKELSKYQNLKQVIWCQEEHYNMGAWQYIRSKLEETIQNTKCEVELAYVGRETSSSPAAGYMKLHLEELTKFLKKAFE